MEMPAPFWLAILPHVPNIENLSACIIQVPDRVPDEKNPFGFFLFTLPTGDTVDFPLSVVGWIQYAPENVLFSGEKCTERPDIWEVIFDEDVVIVSDGYTDYSTRVLAPDGQEVPICTQERTRCLIAAFTSLMDANAWLAEKTSRKGAHPLPS